VSTRASLAPHSNFEAQAEVNDQDGNPRDRRRIRLESRPTTAERSSSGRLRALRPRPEEAATSQSGDPATRDSHAKAIVAPPVGSSRIAHQLHEDQDASRRPRRVIEARSHTWLTRPNLQAYVSPPQANGLHRRPPEDCRRPRSAMVAMALELLRGANMSSIGRGAQHLVRAIVLVVGCARSRRAGRLSPPVRCINRYQHAQRKAFLLRLDLHTRSVQRCAYADMRSLNGQIEFLLPRITGCWDAKADGLPRTT